MKAFSIEGRGSYSEKHYKELENKIEGPVNSRRDAAAWLKGTKSKKTVARNADFDALPIQDKKAVTSASLLGVTYVRSKVKKHFALHALV